MTIVDVGGLLRWVCGDDIFIFIIIIIIIIIILSKLWWVSCGLSKWVVGGYDWVGCADRGG